MNQINDILASRQINYDSNFTAIGVAGTLTSLAYMDLNLKKYNPARINGHILTRSKIRKYIQNLSKMTHNQMIKEYPEVMEGRADIFIAGILILDGFMGYYNQEKIIVSTGGIRHGALLKG
jgi:exopolyphosphatase/guanosine-5'-triphosphate,3'-diphosphate pyrophosphatase